MGVTAKLTGLTEMTAQVDPFNHQSQVTAKGDTPSPFFVRQWQNLLQLVRDTADVAAAALAAQTTADAALPKALAQNHVFVGNASGIATDVATSGDVTIVASGATTIGANKVQESKLDLADNATFNSSTTKHGFLKKLSNTSTEFMNGQGDWATPSSASITAKDEGSTLTAAVTSLNFVGSGVVATNSSGDVTVTVSGSSGGSGDTNPFSDGGLTKPAAADFSISDDTTAGHGTGSKVDLSSRGVEFTNTRGSVSTQSLFYKAAVSSTLGAVTAYVSPNFGGTNALQYFYGLAVRDNTGKVDAFGLAFNAGVGNTVWYHHTFTNISTAPTQTAFSGGHMACGRPAWLKLAKVSTNFVFSASMNGETYDTIATVSATGFIGSTINDVGIILWNNMNNGSQIINLDCFSFVHS